MVTSPTATISTPVITSELATSPTAVSAPPEPYFAGPGLDLVALRSPGSGHRPLLSWEPLESAASYTLLVLDPDGQPWWAWTGEGTAVVLGGVETSAEIGGPAARPGVRWVVFAHDAEGRLVGSSPLASVTA